jgi:outer membrane protein, multidrug efflux system
VRRGVLLALIAVILAACTVGPDYRRPEMPLPSVYRGLDPTAPAEPGSLGDLAWWAVFEDEALQALIRTALAENYDLRVSAARILDAQAQLVATRSNQFPTIDGTAEALYSQTEGDRPPLFTLENSFIPQASANLSFELDFWGRWRRATEAARADLLATEEGRHVVLSDLVSNVALAYFQLRTLDLSLEIARRTLAVRQDSLRLVRLREEGGVVSMADVHQAETLVSGALREIPDFERQIEQAENLISLLLGRSPGPVPRGRALEGQIALPSLPAGLPAALLERRPDVRAAEQQLVAANAQIGVAKSEFFPRIVLLGNIGVAGGVQNSMSFGPVGLFGIGPTLTVPIFNAGRVQAGVDSAEARVQEAVARYQQTVQQALREVSDALVGHRKRQATRREQETLVQVLRNATALSNVRYDGGVTSYLEVLDNERQFFTAELDLARARRDEVLAVVQLYRALGGGWQSEHSTQRAAAH